MPKLNLQEPESFAESYHWKKLYSFTYIAMLITMVWVGVRDEITVIVAICFGALDVYLNQSRTMVAMFLFFVVVYVLIPLALRYFFGKRGSSGENLGE